MDTGLKTSGGEGGIRTPGTLSGTPVFKTGAINHSATSPLLILRPRLLMGREFPARISLHDSSGPSSSANPFGRIPIRITV